MFPKNKFNNPKEYKVKDNTVATKNIILSELFRIKENYIISIKIVYKISGSFGIQIQF